MEDLINSMSNLIYHIAREFTSDKDLIDELYNQGVLGVYDAYENYDKSSKTKFSSYAYMYIYGKMYNYLNSNRPIKINKDIMKLYKLILKTKDYLCQKEKMEVSNKMIANYLNMDESIIERTINMVSEPLSLDYEYNESNLFSFIKNQDEIDNLEIRELLDSLTEEQRKVIYYKYYSGYSQHEIAKIMNMSQSGVSRCEKKGIEKMRVRSLN